MRSSDPRAQAGRFLASFIAAIVATAAGLLALCWLADPTGLLRETGLSPGICASGIHTHEDRFVKPLLIPTLQPDEVILGSSRVAYGIREQAFEGRRVANLALAGATLEEIDRLARQAIDAGHVRRIWIGLDFSAFVADQTQYREPLLMPASGQARRQVAVRWGLLGPRAVRATIRSLLVDEGCARPISTRSGFSARSISPLPTAAQNRRLMAAVAVEWDRSPTHRRFVYQRRLRLFADLLAHARRRGVAIVAFTGPISSFYRESLAGSGLAGEFARWHLDVRSLVDAADGTFVAAQDERFLAPVQARLCDRSAPPDCLFFDATHFRPEIGDAVVRRALAPREPHGIPPPS